jgi:poly(A) polymerase
MVMGKEAEDFDIVTDASPQQVMQIFRRTIPVGVQFGIVIVMVKGHKYEVAQFRDSTGADDPLREDARHRDFTINGMFYDPSTDRLFDYVGGQQDIEQRLIRGIENPLARLEEDKLRMIRAVRFATSFDYEIDPATFDAMCQLASRISEVSAERIRDELLKILMTPRPARGIRLLDKSGLLEHILPEVAAMKGVQQPREFHPEGDVFIHTLLMLHYMSEREKDLSPELALAALLHDVGKPDTFIHTDRIRFPNHAKVGAQIAEQICLRFKCSTKMTEKIVLLIKEHLKFFTVEQMRTSKLKRFLRQDYIDDLLELHLLDCLSSNRDLHHYEFCQKKLEAFRQEAMRPPKLISGKDLIRLGFTPGPLFKEVLEYIEDAQLEGIVSTRKNALKLVKEIQETLAPEKRET